MSVENPGSCEFPELAQDGITHTVAAPADSAIEVNVPMPKVRLTLKPGQSVTLIGRRTPLLETDRFLLEKNEWILPLTDSESQLNQVPGILSQDDQKAPQDNQEPASDDPPYSPEF